MKNINNILLFRILPQPKIKNWVIGVVTFFTFVFSATLIVPTDYPNIQAGIDASVDGDTVLVLDGVYSGEGNVDLTFDNSAFLTVMSQNGPQNCIIDCNYSSRFAFFSSGYTKLMGISIHNGISMYGGALFVCCGANTIISNCIFSNNHALFNGGAIYADISDPIFNNCTFYGNTAEEEGDNIYIGIASIPIFQNCIIGGQIAPGEYNPQIFYSILTDSVSFNVYDGTFIGNPLLDDPENNNFNLQLESPCINAGNPDIQLDPDSTRADIGALYFNLDLMGDSNFDTEINILDIVLTVNVILEFIEGFNAQIWAMDMDNNLEINVLDIILIINQIFYGD